MIFLTEKDFVHSEVQTEALYVQVHNSNKQESL
jgi:hypothetical protein